MKNSTGYRYHRQWHREWLIALGFVLGLGIATRASAQAVITHGGETIHSIGDEDGECLNEEECTVDRMRALSAPSLGVSVFGGAPAGVAALGVHWRLDLPMGGIRGGASVTRLADSSARLRLDVGDFHNLFFCTTADGRFLAPIVGAAKNACRPDGTLSMGLGLPRLQIDPTRSRFQARWVSVETSVNFFQNGLGWDFLRRRLNLTVGVDAETLSEGRSQSTLRGLLGVSGLIRTADGRWELSGAARVRPLLAGGGPVWVDRVGEASVFAGRNFLLPGRLNGKVGVEGRLASSTDPRRHSAGFATPEEVSQYTVGLLFGVNHEFGMF